MWRRYSCSLAWGSLHPQPFIAAKLVRENASGRPICPGVKSRPSILPTISDRNSLKIDPNRVRFLGKSGKTG